MSITVIKGGMMTTLQDEGRYGYQHIGMPVSGAMDEMAAAIANILVGNKRGDVVLETTYGGLEIKAESDILIALCGGGSEALVEGKSLPFWKPIHLPAGAIVKFITTLNGCRTYIAIAGGWKGDKVLGSCSTYLPIQIGGHGGKAIKAGDTIESNREISNTSELIIDRLKGESINYPKWGVYSNEFVNYAATTISVLTGPEWEWFDEATQQNFFSNTYTIDAASNRMGYGLKGAALDLKTSRQLLSTAVNKGTIQVTSGGSPILLMADAQTTGGYPRIAQVVAVDLPICAQLKTGDVIKFERMNLEDAERAYIVQQQKLEDLEKRIASIWMNE